MPKYKLIPLSLCWCSANLFCPLVGLAQDKFVPTLPPISNNSQELPPAPNSNNNYLPSEIPSGTFNSDDFIPPKSTTPPVYKDDTLNPLNIYYLNIGDGISINVERFADFNTSGQIDPEGNILIPIVGRMNLKGLTLKEAEAKISNHLGSLYLQKKPKVNVILSSPRPTKLTIVGEVFRPGFYNLGPGVAINDLLTLAGGSTKNADLRSIIIRRQLSNNKIIERKIDIFTPLQTGQPLPNIAFQGGDTVIISKMEVGNDQDYNRDLIAKTSLVQQTIRVRFWTEGGSGIGVVTVPNGSTILDILNSATANNNQQLIDGTNVALLRYDPEKGGVITQRIDGKRAIKGDISQNVTLQDEDVIIVGRTLLGKVIGALGLITQPFQSLFSFVAFINTLDNLFN
jgi:polysaccharide biosynthesis/export protein